MSKRKQETRPARRLVQGHKARPKDYTPEEEAKLQTLFPTAPKATVLKALPGRDWTGLQRAAARRGINRPRRPHNAKWEGSPIEKLHARYAEEGALSLAKELGFTPAQVRSKAMTEGLSYKPRPKVRPVKRAIQRETSEQKAAREARLKKLYPNSYPFKKAEKKAKAVVTKSPKPVAVQPVKRSPATPLLNARIEARRKAEKQEAERPKTLVTAAEVRALPAAHRARLAWTAAAYRGPEAATAAFHEAMRKVG